MQVILAVLAVVVVIDQALLLVVLARLVETMAAQVTLVVLAVVGAVQMLLVVMLQVLVALDRVELVYHLHIADRLFIMLVAVAVVVTQVAHITTAGQVVAVQVVKVTHLMV